MDVLTIVFKRAWSFIARLSCVRYICGALLMMQCLESSALDSARLKATLQEQSLPTHIVLTQDAGLEGFSFILLEQDGFWLPLLAHNSGNVLLGLTQDLVFSTNEKFTQTMQDVLQKTRENNKRVIDNNVLAIFDKYEQYLVRLPATNTAKYDTYMVLDPNCPYCAKEVEKLEEYLKDSNLILLVVGILKQDSIYKAATIHAMQEKATSKDAKLANLHLAFAQSFRADAAITPNDATYLSLVRLGLDLQKAGLQAVPYIIKQAKQTP